MIYPPISVDVCPICGAADYDGDSYRNRKVYRCFTVVVACEGGWRIDMQNDKCRIAELEASLKSVYQNKVELYEEIAELEAKNERLKSDVVNVGALAHNYGIEKDKKVERLRAMLLADNETKALALGGGCRIKFLGEVIMQKLDKQAAYTAKLTADAEGSNGGD